MKDKKYRIGLTVILITFLVSLPIYLLLFAVPIVLIGVLLVWFSKATIEKQTLWTAFPIRFGYPSFCVFMHLLGSIGTATAQKRDSSFPKNFKGKALVMQQIDSGQTVMKKGGREHFIFSENGVLLYQNSIESGYRNPEYFQGRILATGIDLRPVFYNAPKRYAS